MPYEISNTFHFIFEDQSIDLCDFFVIGTVPIVLVLVVLCTKILRYENHLIVVDFWEAAMVGFPLCWSWYSAPVELSLDEQ